MSMVAPREATLLPAIPSNGDLVEDVYRITPLQEGMLFHSLNAPGSGAYMNQQSYAFRGKLDFPRFRSAFERVIARHPVMRTSYGLDAQGRPRQVVRRRAEQPWTELDWTSVPEAEQGARLAQLLEADRRIDFDLGKAPLMHATMIRRGPDLYQFVWRYYLGLLDGWSVGVVLAEVLAVYSAELRGVAPMLPPPIPYRAYIDWLDKQDRSRGADYWRKLLRGFTSPTRLREDHAPGRAAPQGDPYHEVDVYLPDADARALRAFARVQRLTMHSVFLGAWALELARQTGSTDVVFGNVVAGRPVELAGFERMVGLFINNLPVRAVLSADAALLPWLRALQDQQAEARQYEYMSLPDVQRGSEVPRGVPLLHSVVVFQNYPLKASLEGVGDLTMVEANCVERNSFPIMVVVEPSTRMLLRFIYDSRLFEEATIRRLTERLRHLVNSITAQEQQTLGMVLHRAAARQEESAIS